jgi:hypothetical protein
MIRFEAWNPTSTIRYNLTADSYFQIHAIPKGTYGSIGGVSTLDDVITAATADNDVNVPATDPVIFRDGNEDITPLSVVKLDVSVIPALIVEVPGINNPGLRVQSTVAPLNTVTLEPDSLDFSAVLDQDHSISGANLDVVAGQDLRLYANNYGTAGSITIGVGGMDTPDEIEFVKGFTVGETSDHPVTPVDDKGQFWVNEAGEPIFTSASNAAVDPGTDYDLTTATPLTLDQVITVAPIDNALTVPSGNPIIFTDGTVAGLTPLTVSKLAGGAVPGIDLIGGTQSHVGLRISNTGNDSGLKLTSDQLAPIAGADEGALTIGGALTSAVSAGELAIVATGTGSAVDGGDVVIAGGFSGSGDGGDVTIEGGFSTSGARGSIAVGFDTPVEIRFGQGITIMESSSQPLTGTQDAKGQFWVNNATSPNKPYYTDEDGVSFDLTIGSGVGDVTATAALPDNALIRGDDSAGSKGVQGDAASTLSDVGDLLIENDITAGNDVIATNDVTSTVDVNVGVDLNIPTGDIVIGVGQTVDGRDVSVDGGVLDGHVGATTGNPHEVEGVDVKSTAIGAGLNLTSTAGGVAEWTSTGTGNVISALDITDHTIVRGDGGVKGVQESGIAIDDTDNITGVVDLTLTGDITSTGAVLITGASAGSDTIIIDNGTDAYGTTVRPDGLAFAEGGATELGYSIVVYPKNDAAKADDITIEAGTNVGAGDGGDILIDSGAGAGAGADGQILLGSLLNTSAIGLASTGITTTVSGPLTAEEGIGVTGDLTVTGSIDGIADLNTDVTANTAHTGGDGADHANVALNDTHRGLTDDNPHGVDLDNLGAGTLAHLNDKVADATLHDTHAGGDVTGGVTLTIADEAVTLAKMANMATARTVTGTHGSHTGGDVTGTENLTIEAGVVTLAKMADMATASFIGRDTAATGVPEILSGTDATALLDEFAKDSGTQGVVPASAGGTSAFLRADGTWQTPGGGGDVSATGTPLVTEYARWTNATTIEGRTLAETLADLSLEIGTDVQAWDTVLDSTTAAFQTADETKLDFITATQGIDLDDFAAIASMAQDTFAGRITASTGAPEELSATQATAMLNLATTSLAGLGPARTGGASTDYLSADGTYSVPPGGSAATLTKSITVEDPAADEDISMFFTTVAITVTQLSAVITGTTSVTYTIRHHTDRSNAGNEVVTGGTAVSSASTGDTTGIITTSFNDETIPVDSFVWIETTALTDTPDSLNVTIEYTED